MTIYQSVKVKTTCNACGRTSEELFNKEVPIDWAPPGRKKAILANLLRKVLKGTYNSDLAPKMFEYLMNDAAKRYSREFPGTTFSAPTRRLAAKKMSKQEEYPLLHGEYSLASLTR